MPLAISINANSIINVQCERTLAMPVNANTMVNVNRITDRCKNITFSHTSFVGGNTGRARLI